MIDFKIFVFQRLNAFKLKKRLHVGLAAQLHAAGQRVAPAAVTHPVPIHIQVSNNKVY